MKKCRMCSKDLIGKERALCKHCKEAGKDRAKKVVVGIVTTLGVATAAVVKLAPKAGPQVRKAIDGLRRLK